MDDRIGREKNSSPTIDNISYAIATILTSLMTKIAHHRWLSHISRQAQQYWYRGLRLQTFRFRSVSSPGMDAVREIIARGFVPASHACHCAILRL